MATTDTPSQPHAAISSECGPFPRSYDAQCARIQSTRVLQSQAKTCPEMDTNFSSPNASSLFPHIRLYGCDRIGRRTTDKLVSLGGHTKHTAQQAAHVRTAPFALPPTTMPLWVVASLFTQVPNLSSARENGFTGMRRYPLAVWIACTSWPWHERTGRQGRPGGRAGRSHPAPARSLTALLSFHQCTGP